MTLWWVKAPLLPARVGLIHQNTAPGAQCHFENRKCLRMWEAFNVSYHTQLPQAKYCVCSWVDWHSIGMSGSFLFPPRGWKYGRFPPPLQFFFCCYFWTPCGFSPSSVIPFLKTSCLLASIKTKKEEGGMADRSGFAPVTPRGQRSTHCRGPKRIEGLWNTPDETKDELSDF